VYCKDNSLLFLARFLTKLGQQEHQRPSTPSVTSAFALDDLCQQKIILLTLNKHLSSFNKTAPARSTFV
jgi:hypothetical protein